MMSGSGSREEFVKNLLAQDPPSTDEQGRHHEDLFKQIKRRACRQKAVIIAIFIAVYLVAFGAFMLRQYTNNVVHSICWGAVSLHIMLWSLVYILRGIYSGMEETVNKSFSREEKPPSSNQNRFITVLAILLFVFNTILLHRSFFLTNPLRAAQKAIGTLWAPTFFLIFYSFSTAEFIAKLWLEHERMRLYMSTSKSSDCSD